MLILVLVLIGLLALGALIGGIVGAIVTGDPNYTIAWAVSMGVLVLCLVVVAPSIARRAVSGTDRPMSRLPRAARTTIGIVLVLAGATLALIPSADTLSRIGTDQSFLTGPNQVRAVTALAQTIGSHELVDIDFYDSYVDAQAPSHPGADTTDNFEYRYGRVARLGAESGSAGLTKVAQYDGRQVDFALIPKLIKDAEKRTKITSPTSIHVAVMQPLDTKSGQEPTINVDLESNYRSDQLHYSPTGKFIDGVGDGFADN
ncbi:MAG TPA: hypothetical protein VHZ81_05815 [Galbitalea sp.]|nr:hypothetical protein [Galbitalea sp.]